MNSETLTIDFLEKLFTTYKNADDENFKAFIGTLIKSGMNHMFMTPPKVTQPRRVYKRQAMQEKTAPTEVRQVHVETYPSMATNG